MVNQIVSFLSLLVGEALSIISENIFAKRIHDGKSFYASLPLPLILIIIGGFLLVVGYGTGIRGFRNIWIVVLLSIFSIVLVEPAVSYLLFREFPTKGQYIGIALSIVGIVIATTVK